MIDTCALYGTTSYANNWLSVNILIVLISLLAIAVAYTLSSFFPSSTRSRLRGFVRFEMIQMIISVALIAALLALAAGACTISAQISSSLVSQPMGPFQYANYYIGANLLNTGLSLLSNLYATSVTYAVDATVLKSIAGVGTRIYGTNLKNVPGFGPLLSYLFNKPTYPPYFGFIEYEKIPSLDISQIYNLVGSTYLDVFSPIILTALGLLFVQFLALPIMQYTAFVVVLPVAIAMRSLAFFSSTIGEASNALIAIAIAFYIIYPMTIAFNAWAINWIFSVQNPANQYVNLAFTVNTVSPITFFKIQPPQGSAANAMDAEFNYLLPNTSSISSAKFYLQGLNIPGTLRTYMNQMAQFVFESVLLFALDVSITVGLAISIYKALRSGLGEAGRFW